MSKDNEDLANNETKNQLLQIATSVVYEHLEFRHVLKKQDVYKKITVKCIFRSSICVLMVGAEKLISCTRCILSERTRRAMCSKIAGIRTRQVFAGSKLADLKFMQSILSTHSCTRQC